jgi:hypothetical protein
MKPARLDDVVRAGLLAVLIAPVFAYANPVVSQAGNLASNGNFEYGSPVEISSGYAQSTGSALSDWQQWGNTFPTTVTTSWANSPLIEGDHLAHITGNLNDGLYQYSYWAPGDYTLSAWVYALKGSAHLILAGNNGSATILGSASTQTGQWQYLTVTAYLNGSFGGPVLYGASNDSSFYIDGVWFNAGTESKSPFDPSSGFAPNAPVPEPESYALLLAGLGLLGAAVKRRKAQQV